MDPFEEYALACCFERAGIAEWAEALERCGAAVHAMASELRYQLARDENIAEGSDDLRWRRRLERTPVAKKKGHLAELLRGTGELLALLRRGDEETRATRWGLARQTRTWARMSARICATLGLGENDLGAGLDLTALERLNTAGLLELGDFLRCSAGDLELVAMWLTSPARIGKCRRPGTPGRPTDVPKALLEARTRAMGIGLKEVADRLIALGIEEPKVLYAVPGTDGERRAKVTVLADRLRPARPRRRKK